MLQIVIHGRGGQGAQLAGNLLAMAFFAEGRQVQTFATYGGARRGTPVSSSIRVDDRPIRLRCDIEQAAGAARAAGARLPGAARGRQRHRAAPRPRPDREFRAARCLRLRGRGAGPVDAERHHRRRGAEGQPAERGRLPRGLPPDRSAVAQGRRMSALPLPPTTWTTGNPDVFKTGTWRSALPVYRNPPSPCHLACPVSGGIAAWIRQAAVRDWHGAWTTLTENNPFPAVAGRVCHRPCESACNRGGYDAPISICRP